jgi:hypothetical protein
MIDTYHDPLSPEPELPLCSVLKEQALVRKYKSTKGITCGNISYDDRPCVKLIVEES